MPDTVNDVLTHTDWPLLAQQKAALSGLLLNDMAELGISGGADALEGLLSWMDAVMDAAEAEGFPVVFLTEDEE